MTDSVLPGLPQPEPREMTQAEVCVVNLQASIIQLCSQAIEENPDLNPADGAAEIGSIVGRTLATLMPPGAARLGLLVAFERSHGEPMNFIRVNQAKEALTQLADRRRKAEAVSAGGIIIPGKD
jgi:hypothetical protein